MIQLSLLRHIVQKVSGATSLQDALDTLVSAVQQAMQTEACTVYMIDKRQSKYALVATQGLNQKMVKHIRFGLSEGLVGYVGQREEPINLEAASLHEKFLYHPEVGEDKYNAFLGVPIIHHKRVMGVLAVQQVDKRKFDETDEAFLVTISAQLAGIFANAEFTGELRELFASNRETRSSKDVIFKGIPAVPGVAIGKAVIIYPVADLDAIPNRKTDNIDHEIAIFDTALQAAKQDITALSAKIGKILPKEELAIFQAYIGLLDSVNLVDDIKNEIRTGQWAQGALRKVIKKYAHQFSSMEDEYIKERATDIKDLGRRILLHLQARQPAVVDYPDNTILLGEEITPTDLAAIPEGRLAGIISMKGTANAHTAIIARSLNLPTVMGVSGIVLDRTRDKNVVLDGYLGKVYINPEANLLENFKKLLNEEYELEKSLEDLRQAEAITPDGYRMDLLVNAGLAADAGMSLSVGADGVGLYRTEISFMAREYFPSEEDQRIIYRQLLQSMAPQQVTMRTLDIGGDKMLPYFPMNNEDNPFLGWRGIRFTLDHPEVLLIQLRALLKASVDLNNLQILLPMITRIQEIDESMQHITQAFSELAEEGHKLVMPPIGAMIEVPAAVYQAKEIAKKVEFLSIGTNDLVQYLLAVDRNNARVASLYESLHPSVIKALIQVVTCAHEEGKPVGVCGEMASDPLCAILLLGMGCDYLSMNAASLPRIKWVIRSFNLSSSRKILNQVLKLETANQIRVVLESHLTDAGLGGLIRAGKH